MQKGTAQDVWQEGMALKVVARPCLLRGKQGSGYSGDRGFSEGQGAGLQEEVESFRGLSWRRNTQKEGKELRKGKWEVWLPWILGFTLSVYSLVIFLLIVYVDYLII